MLTSECSNLEHNKSNLRERVRECYGVLHQSQQYFSYIVAVSSIGGGNRNTGENQ